MCAFAARVLHLGALYVISSELKVATAEYLSDFHSQSSDLVDY